MKPPSQWKDSGQSSKHSTISPCGQKRILELGWNIGTLIGNSGLPFSLFFTPKYNLCADILTSPHDSALKVFLHWIKLVCYKMQLFFHIHFQLLSANWAVLCLVPRPPWAPSQRACGPHSSGIAGQSFSWPAWVVWLCRGPSNLCLHQYWSELPPLPCVGQGRCCGGSPLLLGALPTRNDHPEWAFCNHLRYNLES